MKIKKAKKRDLKEIGKLMLKEFSKPPFNEREKLSSVLKSLEFYYKNAEIYIITKNKILGVIVFQVEQWWEGKVAIIQDLAVKKEFQKKNIGKELTNFLENYSRKKNIKKITFKTNSKSSAIKFYKKLGYKINKKIISMEKVI
jgi:ribosomal protein S18 acetylase RimI-like enzyme